LGVGHKADNLALQKITVAKSIEVKTRSNLAESSKEDYGSKSALFLLMMKLSLLLLPP
jgi:hypothetical protein